MKIFEQASKDLKEKLSAVMAEKRLAVIKEPKVPTVAKKSKLSKFAYMSGLIILCLSCGCNIFTKDKEEIKKIVSDVYDEALEEDVKNLKDIKNI